MKIGFATIEDVDAIANVNRAAIHITCKPYYSNNIIAQWANPDFVKKIQQISIAINDDETIVLVAKKDGKVIGYGMLDLKKNYLGAVYVHPSYGRKQIGTTILILLEKEARNKGIDELFLDASINSQKF